MLTPQYIMSVGLSLLLMVLLCWLSTLLHLTDFAGGNAASRPWLLEQLAAIPPALALALSASMPLAFLLNPLDAMHRQGRHRFLHTCRRLVSAPFMAIRFEDFFLGDQVTSQSKALHDVFYLLYFCISGAHMSEAPLTKFPIAIGVLFPFFPLWWRFMQCFRRYADQGQVKGKVRWFFWYVDKKWHHLHNAGKYFSSLVVVFSSLGKHSSDGLWYFWLLTAIWSTAYSFFWDMWYDWGVCRNTLPGKRNWLLRDKIMYPQPVYYICMAADLLLRLCWTLTINPFYEDTLSAPVSTFLFGCLEVSRRIMWNCFRVENEQLHNVGQFRAIAEVPLPFNQEEFADRVEQVRQMKQLKSKSKRPETGAAVVPA
jgi:hypothetical protein